MNQKNKIELYLARKLKTLPPEELRKLIHTSDQLAWFDRIDNDFSLISLCWQARIKGDNDPLEQLLEARKIKEIKYTEINLQVDYYRALWELIQVSYSAIKAEAKRNKLKDFSFTKARDLFEQIISDDSKNAVNVCQQYSEISSESIAKTSLNSIRALKGNIPQSQIDRLCQENSSYYRRMGLPRNNWLAFCLIVADDILQKPRSANQKIVTIELEDLKKASARVNQ